MKTSQKASMKKAAKITITILIPCLVILAVMSSLFPNSAIGYRKIFIDSHTNTYKQGVNFQYGQYAFNIKLSETKIEPSLNDCSNLLENGIFNPRADEFFANQANPNYWPKEDCIVANKKMTDESNNTKNMQIFYSIKNNSDNIGTIQKDWLTVLGEDGKILSNGGEKMTMAPYNTIKNNTKATIHNSTISNITIKLPGNAPQIVQIEN